MPPQLSIRIPDQQLSSITRFVTVDPGEIEKLVECILTSKPFQDVEDLAAHCQSVTTISDDAIEDVISISINLSRVQRTFHQSSEEVTKLVGESLARRLKDGWDNSKRAAWEDRAHLLQRLLVPDGTIEIMSKARELLQECQTVFLNSNVLTDVRYIYDKDATRVLGGMILSTLCIDFVEGQNELQQLHVAVSLADIEKLISQLQRAQQKVKVTTELLAKNSLEELTPKKDAQP